MAKTMEELMRECNPQARKAVRDAIQCLAEEIECDCASEGIEMEDTQKVTNLLLTLLDIN